MYKNIFDEPKNHPDDIKIEKTNRYMDLFGTHSEVTTASPNDAKYDLFGGQNVKNTDIFAGVSAKPATQSAQPAVPINSVNTSAMFDCSYVDRMHIENDFKRLARENEACTNVLIDVAQDLQREYSRIEDEYANLQKLVENIKNAVDPKKNWLGITKPVDVNEVNRLIDSAQEYTKNPFKIDFFLVSRIN